MECPRVALIDDTRVSGGHDYVPDIATGRADEAYCLAVIIGGCLVPGRILRIPFGRAGLAQQFTGSGVISHFSASSFPRHNPTRHSPSFPGSRYTRVWQPAACSL